jgi:hypothetical protein
MAQPMLRRREGRMPNTLLTTRAWSLNERKETAAMDLACLRKLEPLNSLGMARRNRDALRRAPGA